MRNINVDIIINSLKDLFPEAENRYLAKMFFGGISKENIKG